MCWLTFLNQTPTYERRYNQVRHFSSVTFGVSGSIYYLCTHDGLYTICPTTRFRCAAGTINQKPKTLALQSVGRIRALLRGATAPHPAKRVTINHAHPTAPVLTISSTDCGRGSTASQRFTVWFNLIRAHPTAPVLTISSTDCGRGSTASQRSTVWFSLLTPFGQGLRAPSPQIRGTCSHGSHVPWNYSVLRPVAPALSPKAVSVRAFGTNGLFYRLAHSIKRVTIPQARDIPTSA